MSPAVIEPPRKWTVSRIMARRGGPLLSGYQRPAPLGRQRQPHRGAGREALPRRGRDPELRAVRGLDQIIAGAAEEDVADHPALDGVGVRRPGGVVREADVVLADAYRDLRAH